MWWKYFCGWNCRKYDNVRYITCKSLYKDTKDKSTKEITRKTNIPKKKLKNTKDKIAKDKFQSNERSKYKNIRQAAGGYLKNFQLQVYLKCQ